jgi:hypothetical protein
MNKLTKFRSLSLKRLLMPCLAALAAWVLLAPAAQATPYVVKLTQEGGNVVARGSGSIDLTGLTGIGPYVWFDALSPSEGWVLTGTTGPLVTVDGYVGFTGLPSFGSGGEARTTVGGGDAVGVIVALDRLFVPSGYVNDKALSSSASWDPATFTTLGVTPGKYVWTWGSLADQSFTLLIGNVASVPEPGSLAMLGLGLLLIGGGFGWRKRRDRKQA